MEEIIQKPITEQKTPEAEFIPKSRAHKAVFMKALMDEYPTAVVAFMLAGAFFGFIAGFFVGLLV